MKLNRFLKITKCAKFTVLVYLKGYTKEQREMGEDLFKIISLERDKAGRISRFSYAEFAKCKVKRIVPHSEETSVVVEI